MDRAMYDTALRYFNVLCELLVRVKTLKLNVLFNTLPALNACGMGTPSLITSEYYTIEFCMNGLSLFLKSNA